MLPCKSYNVTHTKYFLQNRGVFPVSQLQTSVDISSHPLLLSLILPKPKHRKTKEQGKFPAGCRASRGGRERRGTGRR